MELEKLNKKQKIELIRQIRSGEVFVLNGQIFDGVIIEKNGIYFFNNKPVILEKLNEFSGTLVILPDNGRSD